MIDLDELERRHNGYGTTPDDIPALISELRDLRSQLAESQRENERLEAELRIAKNPGAWAGPS